MENLTVLRPERAATIGIAKGDGGLRPVESSGVAGAAFQQLADKVADVGGAKGMSLLSVTACPDPGEGSRDLSLLGKAVPMLPRLAPTVHLDLVLEFKGLMPGASIRLSGAAPDYQRNEDAILALAGSQPRSPELSAWTSAGMSLPPCRRTTSRASGRSLLI